MKTGNIMKAALGAVALLGTTLAQAQHVIVTWGSTSAVPLGGGLTAVLMGLALLAVGMWVMRRSPAAQRMLGALAVVGVMTGVAVDQNAEAAGDADMSLRTSPTRFDACTFIGDYIVAQNDTGATITLRTVTKEYDACGDEDVPNIPLSAQVKAEGGLSECAGDLTLAAGAQCKVTLPRPS